ncbi:major facilitator superfamily domain-containing protein [Colletotrichum godetiae]|uniref:Major facilitator superfamily domain-containing protein n=1 Tax=Colletotrichum godetiae TaxID=1209918 RepID=A0AAJ0A713_9PEZI|nr:major facilitator superfamily domain-containing protein [Colletotrichum godetiae]KAK1657665.1 major facilitator superfamily domain-containing protein [Colletotrichum godetiae]
MDAASILSDRSESVYNVDGAAPNHAGQAGDARTHHRTNAYVVALLCLLNFICTFDGTVLSTAITAIAQDIQGSTLEAFWTNTSLSLSSTVSQPFWIRLADEMDRLGMTLCALALFTLGSSMALLADSFALLIAARTAQGFGIGGLTALTNIIVLDLVTSRESGALLGWVNSVRALGSACGPVVGAALSQHRTWRWAFWVNVPFAMLAFMSAPSLLRNTERVGVLRARDALKRIDWLGALLLLASLTGFLVPLTWGGILFDWISPHTLLPMSLCAAGLAGFALYSKRVPRQPIMRGALFSSAHGIVAHCGALVHGVAIFSLLYYLPLYYTIAKEASAAQAALYVLPNTVIAALASAASGILVSKTGRYRILLWVGWATTTLGSGILTVVTDRMTVAVSVALSLVSGAGIGVLFTTLSLAAQASVSAADASAASSMTNFFRSLGQTMGIAVGGVVVQNVFRSVVEASEVYRPYAAAWARNIARVAQALKAATGAGKEDLEDVIVPAIVKSTRAVWIFLCVLSATQLALSIICIKDLSLDGSDAVSEDRSATLKTSRLVISQPQLHRPFTDPAAASSFVR